jgi:hypothetical protein
MTLAEFLEARISEDEAIARAASEPDWSVVGNSLAGARFIAHHDPARVLAECEAKRSIITEHQPVDCGNVRHPNGVHCSVCEYDDIERGWWPCPTLRFLAAPYSSHSDFDPSWRTP